MRAFDRTKLAAGGCRLTTDLFYMASDHLSSASLMMDASGTTVSSQRYLPFGEVRDIDGLTGITQTDLGYTGQRNYAGFGLVDYHARFYSPSLGRFTQTDTVIPGATNTQSWNRYTYAYNNPLNYTDPSGHVPCSGDGWCVGDILSAAQVTLLFGGGTGGSIDDEGPEVIYSMPAWQTDDQGNLISSKNKFNYPGTGENKVKDDPFIEGKSGQAAKGWDRLSGYSVNMIGYSAGTEATLMAAVMRVQAGYDVNNVVLLGSNFNSSNFENTTLEFGSISYDDNGNLEMNDWADYIATLTKAGVNVLVVADSTTAEPLAENLNPPGDGKYDYWYYPNEDHNYLRFSTQLRNDVYGWMD
jgi:RHS repeat-associated protein